MKREIREICGGLLRVLLLTAGSALVFGAVWGLADWLRNFGTGLAPLPYLDQSPVGAEIFRRHEPGTLFGFAEDFINWYNVTFRSAARFGSGLGIIGGAFFCLSAVKSYSPVPRFVVGLAAGALIGARAIMMVTSDVPFFFAGGVIGALVTGGYLALAGGALAVPPLPALGLGKGSGEEAT